jgi:pimeloyl-ACP methyl ester carboxylesterase
VTTTSSTVTERTIEVAALSLRLQQDGGGAPLLLLHHSTGHSGWMPLYERLAESFAVTVPDLPGYGHSERPDWAREPRDLAVMMQQLLDKLDLDGVTLVGLGFGGFIAAEMATLNHRRLSRMVLVGAAGIKPQEGEIVDQMLMDHAEYVKLGFRDEASFEQHFGAEVDPEVRDIWDFSRIMTARLTWSPYMHSRRLPHLLGDVQTPTLLVWGEHDRIVPVHCASQYERALPNARLEIVADAGHAVDMEQPEALASLIAGHAGVGGNVA